MSRSVDEENRERRFIRELSEHFGWRALARKFEASRSTSTSRLMDPDLSESARINYERGWAAALTMVLLAPDTYGQEVTEDPPEPPEDESDHWDAFDVPA